MNDEYVDSIWEQLPEHNHDHHGHQGDHAPHAPLGDLAADFVAGARSVLDLGCGSGRHLASLASTGAPVVGVDRSGVALARAERSAAEAGLDEVSFGKIGADERLPLDDNLFDRVWCCGVIEHVVDTQTLLSEIRRVLEPGGELLVVTPDHPLRTRLRIALRGWERHFDPFSSRLRFYSARGLADTLTGCGFERPVLSHDGELLIARARRL